MNEAEKQMRTNLTPLPAAWNDLTHRVIGCAMEVHSNLGPGMIEHVYEHAMIHELRLAGVPFRSQASFRVHYKGIELPEQRLDLFIDQLLVLELKAIEKVPEFHLAKLVGYMRIADAPLGLLINFNVLTLKDGVFRRLNPRATVLRQIASAS